MKSYTKKQLADAAGVSTDTFRRWLIADRAQQKTPSKQTKFTKNLLAHHTP